MYLPTDGNVKMIKKVNIHLVAPMSGNPEYAIKRMCVVASVKIDS